MGHLDKLEALIRKHHGTVLSKELDAYEIPRTYLQMMVTEGKLEQVSRGVYVSIDAVEDEMYALQTKYKKLVYSHETALFLHDLSDRNPINYTATVPSGYKVVPTISDRFKIFYIKKELHELGVVTIDTAFGNQIRTYDVERTICDIVRSKSRIDVQIMNEALRRYVKMKSADYSLLLDYAKTLRVDTILKEYMELLL